MANLLLCRTANNPEATRVEANDPSGKKEEGHGLLNIRTYLKNYHNAKNIIVYELNNFFKKASFAI